MTENSKQNKYYAWLLIKNFDSHPDEITKKIGIKPTKIYVKGEFRLAGKNKPKKVLNKENLWILESELSPEISAEENLKNLIEKIKPYKQKLVEISKNYSVELNLAVYYYEINPGISFEKEIISEISDFGASIYIDIYCLT